MSNIKPENRCSGAGQVVIDSVGRRGYCRRCGRRDVRVTRDNRLWQHSIEGPR